MVKPLLVSRRAVGLRRVEPGDGEADAVDRNGALLDDVGGQLWGQIEGEAPVGGDEVGVGREQRVLRV